VYFVLYYVFYVLSFGVRNDDDDDDDDDDDRRYKVIFSTACRWDCQARIQLQFVRGRIVNNKTHDGNYSQWLTVIVQSISTDFVAVIVLVHARHHLSNNMTGRIILC